jgi:Ca2+-binding RTX toxin-like protein
MSGPLRVLVSFALAAVGTAVLAQPASAAGDTCSYDPSTKVVTVVFPATADVSRLISRSIQGTGIEYEGSPCSTATVRNTRTIDVTAGAGTQELDIYLAHGPFAPGVGSESPGLPEIEWNIDLGDGTDRIDVVGSNAGDFIRFDGRNGLELNGDGDVDGRLRHVERAYVDGGKGDDHLLAPTATLPVFFVGNRGNDVLIGGSRGDRLYGFDGADTLRGRTGSDILRGGAGQDRSFGGAGNDRFHSGTGNDVSLGGPGIDDMQGGGGNDTLSGGAGDDTMHLTDGLVDEADCGDGVDDASDRDPVDTVLVDCETT